MENTTDTKVPATHITYGIIAAAAGIVLFIIFYAFGLYTQKSISWVSTLVFLGLIIAAVISHSKALNGNTTFGNLFAVGFKTAAIATLINILFLVIFVLLVPAYKEGIMEQSRQNMMGRNLTPDQIDTAMLMTQRFFMVRLIAFGLLGGLFVGAIGSVIGAAVAKKNPQATAL
jgi:hypothetical protein